MSDGAKIKYKQAPAVVHRSLVRSGSAPSNAGWNSATLASDDSQHPGGRRQRSDKAVGPFEAIMICLNVLRQRRCCAESP